MRPLQLIFASTLEGVVASKDGLPWVYKEDLAYFRKMTMSHAVIMGRKTFEAMGALKGRNNIVLSKTKANGAGAVFTDSAEHALDMAYAYDNAPFIIGGPTIYDLFLPRVTDVCWTRISAKYSGQTWLPDLSEFREESEVYGETPELSFCSYRRVPQSTSA